MAPTIPIAEDACRNCGAALAGAYCHACGQKRFVERDRRLAQLLGEAFREATSLDGRLWRTLRLLLLHPGRLSREHLDGRRARYYSPIGLFVLASVLYFFAPALTDFNLAFVDQVPGPIALQALDPSAPIAPARLERIRRGGGQVHSALTAPLVERTLAARAARTPGYGMRELADDYDHAAGNVGKALMIAHVPIIALALMLAYWRRRLYFAEHFVVALHLFTFLLLFVQLVLAPLAWLLTRFALAPQAWVGATFRLAIAAIVLGYILVACRTAYRAGWLGALGGLLAVLVGLWFANLWVYRALQFVVTLLLM